MGAILLKWYPHTSTVVIKNDIFKKIGLFDQNRTHGEDIDLWLRVANFYKLWVLNRDLVITGGGKLSFGKSGLSANMQAMFAGEILALKGAVERRQISYYQHIILVIYFGLRYFRRWLIVLFSKITDRIVSSTKGRAR